VSNGEFVVCARTDAKSVEGLEACIKRSKAYIDAGADMIFPEGLFTAEEFQTVAK
jgi:methylisocitrate lyase